MIGSFRLPISKTSDGSNTEPPAYYEAETAPYMNAIGIPYDSNDSIYSGKSNIKIWIAVDDMFKDLKSAGLLPDLFAGYLKIGDTSTKQAVDLITPTSSGIFFGSWVWDKNGAKANGANTHFDTKVNADIRSNPGDNDFGRTITINTVDDAINYSLNSGAYTGSGDTMRDTLYLTWNVATRLGAYFSGKISDNIPVDNAGVFTMTKDNTSILYRNGVNVASADNSLNSFIDGNIYEGTANVVGGSNLYTYVGEITSSFYHKHLPPSKATALYNAINKFEIALGRKKYN